MIDYFFGYERENGCGVRNHVLVIPTVSCAEFTVKKMVSEASQYFSSYDGGIKALNNPYGCGQTGKDLDQTTRTLINIGKNPNVSGVLVVALGCESVNYDKVADEISKVKNVEFLKIQDQGVTKTVDEGVRLLKKLSDEAKKMNRKKCGVENLSIALECGGSDFTSGIASNPVVGKVSDMVVNMGGTTIISEIPEFIGAEHLYAERAISQEVKTEIIDTVHKFEEKLKREAGVDFRGAQPSPGNITGGLTTIEEKSLGAIKKSGSSKVSGVLEYAQIPNKRGHFMMNTPGYDIESVSGMVAGGANLVLFTTGRGTPTGNPVAPVIKITANYETYKIMEDMIDFDCSSVIDGRETILKSSERLWELIIDVANGKPTKAEINRQDDFLIYRIGPTY